MTWQQVAVAALDVLQTIALAWLAIQAQRTSREATRAAGETARAAVTNGPPVEPH